MPSVCASTQIVSQTSRMGAEGKVGWLTKLHVRFCVFDDVYRAIDECDWSRFALYELC